MYRGLGEDMDFIFEWCFSTREIKIHIFKLPCNLLFIMTKRLKFNSKLKYILCQKENLAANVTIQLYIT